MFLNLFSQYIRMKSSSLEKDFKEQKKTSFQTKKIKNLFRLKKELNDTAIKDIKKKINLKKENKEIKIREITYIRNLFEHE